MSKIPEAVTAVQCARPGWRRFSLYEPAEFIKVFLVDKLDFKKVRDCVAVHVPCSSKKTGISSTLEQLAAMCAKEVVPTGVPCCGMAGDRGMRYPDLTAAALQHLDLPNNCSVIGLPQSPSSLHTRMFLHSHAHMLCTL